MFHHCYCSYWFPIHSVEVRMTIAVGDYRRYHFHLMVAKVYHQKDRQVVVGEEVLEHFQSAILEQLELGRPPARTDYQRMELVVELKNYQREMVDYFQRVVFHQNHHHYQMKAVEMRTVEVLMERELMCFHHCYWVAENH